MKVKHEDRNIEINQFKMALNMCDFGVDYITTDLIVMVHQYYRIKGGEFSMDDAAKIRSDWEQKWQKYAQDNKDEQ